MISETRARGYAEQLGLLEEKLGTIAAPIRATDGTVGAINAIFPRSAIKTRDQRGSLQIFAMYQKLFRHFAAFCAIEITTQFLFVGMAVASPMRVHFKPFIGGYKLIKSQPGTGQESIARIRFRNDYKH